MSDTPPLIDAQRLTKRYGPIVAIGDVTAQVSGRIIGLLGPNGAGKSTLLKSLLGLIPYEGSASCSGSKRGRTVHRFAIVSATCPSKKRC